ncbi:MAG: hypothetical protein GX455_06270 [Phycisphaerae bacterium]|nr:hypothetical protein [Phycisphaerae bacterium]
MPQYLVQFVLLVSTLSGGIVPAQGTEVPAIDQRYPISPFVVDVSKPPYSAKGDGVTDDTEALQRALNENVGLDKLLFFPKGTYPREPYADLAKEMERPGQLGQNHSPFR